jgi:hypothetical protein
MEERYHVSIARSVTKADRASECFAVHLIRLGPVGQGDLSIYVCYASNSDRSARHKPQIVASRRTKQNSREADKSARPAKLAQRGSAKGTPIIAVEEGRRKLKSGRA